MSDLDNAINSINASAAKAENTATFLDDMSTFDDQSSVTNPNNGQTVASIPKQVKDRTDELFAAAESDINQSVADAAQSATDAQDAADSIGRYQGLWPDSGGSADKGDTYQTQVGGTPTGQYFTALQNTTVDPVGDNVNWRAVSSGILNVKDFRATGDGVTDDTSAFQSAINAANVKGGTVYVPAGVYAVNGVVLKSNVNIIGDHKESSKLVFFNYSQGDRILANYYGSEPYYDRNGDYLENVIIRNLSLVSDSQNRTGVVDEFDSPLYILNPSSVVIEDCNLWKSTQSVTIESSPDKRNLDNNNKITFNRVQFYDQAYMDSDTSIGSNSYVNVITAVHNGTISNCTFNGSYGSTALRIYESEVDGEAIGSSGWLISNNTFKNQVNVNGNSGYGIYLRGQSSRIIHNMFYDLDGNYIDTQNSQLLNAPNTLSHHKDVVIQNNTFRLTASANFREDALIHCRNSGIRIDSNTFVADWDGSAGANKECIAAKWGESVSITNNEFTTNNSVALELSSTFTRELEYKAMLVSGNVFRTANNSSLGVIRLNTTRDFNAVISGNTFMRIDNSGNVTNALWGVWSDDGYGVNRAKVWFTGNKGYTNPMSALQDIIDFEEIDGEFSYSAVVDPDNANLTNPKIGAMPDIDSVYDLLLPRSGIANGVVAIDVIGDSANSASIEQRRIPNITIDVSSSNGSSIFNTSIFQSTVARLTFNDINFSCTGGNYALLLESRSDVPLITLTNCTWTGGGNGVRLSFNATVYVSGCNMGTGSTAFLLSDMVRVAIVNTSGSGGVVLRRGVTAQMEGSTLGPNILSDASVLTTI